MRGRAVSGAGPGSVVSGAGAGIGLEASQAWLVGLTSSFGPAVPVVFATAFLRELLRPVQLGGFAFIAAGLTLIAIRL
jgi:drug/metabolite transporter (DMT)-like permease